MMRGGDKAAFGVLFDRYYDLLHTFARHIPGDGSIFTLPGNFIHLIDINDTVFRFFNVILCCLNNFQKNILYVFSYVSCLGQ